MRSFDGKPEPTPAEREALLQFLVSVSDAMKLVHGPCTPKPKNIADNDWLPPTDWTPDQDGETEDDYQDPA